MGRGQDLNCCTDYLPSDPRANKGMVTNSYLFGRIIYYIFISMITDKKKQRQVVNQRFKIDDRKNASLHNLSISMQYIQYTHFISSSLERFTTEIWLQVCAFADLQKVLLLRVFLQRQEELPNIVLLGINDWTKTLEDEHGRAKVIGRVLPYSGHAHAHKSFRFLFSTLKIYN